MERIARRIDTYVSELVRAEITRGDRVAAAEHEEAVAKIAIAPIPDAARELAAILVAQHALPEKARIDALHLAICATNKIDYLLTWNCRHLANAARQKNIAQACQSLGYNPPVICTPQQLLEHQS